MGSFERVQRKVRHLHRTVVRHRRVRMFREKYPRFSETLRKRFDRDERFGLHVTIGAALTLFFMWLFFDVFEDLVGEESLIRSDLLVLEYLRAHRQPLLNEIMRFLTTLGNWQVISAGFLLSCLYLTLIKRWHQFAAIFVSVVGGSSFVHLLKTIVQRPRPPRIDALLSERTFSFPSGHSFVAFSFYGLLIYFFFKAVRRNRFRFLLAGCGGLLVLLIGFSRIYLGVHWPSDVLAGYASGAAWLTVHITALETYPDPRRKPFVPEPLPLALGVLIFLVWTGFLLAFFVSHPFAPAELYPAASVIPFIPAMSQRFSA